MTINAVHVSSKRPCDSSLRLDRGFTSAGFPLNLQGSIIHAVELSATALLQCIQHQSVSQLAVLSCTQRVQHVLYVA